MANTDCQTAGSRNAAEEVSEEQPAPFRTGRPSTCQRTGQFRVENEKEEEEEEMPATPGCRHCSACPQRFHQHLEKLTLFTLIQTTGHG